MMSHQTLAFSVPLRLSLTAQTIKRQEMAEINKPKAILVGVEGSLFLFFRKAKKATISGVNNITQPGFIDWLKLVAHKFTFPSSPGSLSGRIFL